MSGHDVMGLLRVKLRTGPKIEMTQTFNGFFNDIDVKAGALLDGGQPVVGHILQMIEDQHAQHVAVRNVRRQLQQQTFLGIAGADAGRVELLNDAQRFLDLGRRYIAAVT